jgi:hypothetical protein
MNHLESDRALQQLELEIYDIIDVAVITAAVSFEDEGAGIGPIKQTPLFSAGHPLADVVSVKVKDVLCVVRRGRMVVNGAVLIAHTLLESIYKSSFANSIASRHNN